MRAIISRSAEPVSVGRSSRDSPTSGLRSLVQRIGEMKQHLSQIRLAARGEAGWER